MKKTIFLIFAIMFLFFGSVIMISKYNYDGTKFSNKSNSINMNGIYYSRDTITNFCFATLTINGNVLSTSCVPCDSLKKHTVVIKLIGSK